MQLAGTQFTNSSAILGNDISTLPDFPAEIRAPVGTLAGVSGFQVHFSSQEIFTPGDELNALVAMNPAALKTNIMDLEKGGILIVNSDAFGASDLHKAAYKSNPLEDRSLKDYHVYRIPINKLNREAVAEVKLSPREADRCKNFFALGLVYWLYERPLEPTLRWIREKFSKNAAVLEANTRSLKAGYNYGETTEALPVHYEVPAAAIKPGRYRKITGNEAIALGLVTAGTLMKKDIVYSGYPITPASDILHHLADLKRFGVRTLQAEDEIAAFGMAIGAAFGGALGVTATSGPGICLKSEGIGLAVMTELPLLIIDVQRGGPSTGLPTKTEQADLLQAMFGRNGECPAAIVAPCSPADCFTMMIEAARLAVTFMTPVFLLSDGYLANVCAEPWLIPKIEDLPEIKVVHPTTPNSNGDATPHFLPYKRGFSAGARNGLCQHAGARAPPGRHRKRGHHRKRQLRPGKPRAHGEGPSSKDCQYRPRNPTFGCGWTRRRRSARHRLGRNLRRHHLRRSTCSAQGPQSSAGAPPLSQSDAAKHWRSRQALQESARSRAQRRPASHALACGIPGRRGRLEQDSRSAVLD